MNNSPKNSATAEREGLPGRCSRPRPVGPCRAFTECPLRFQPDHDRLVEPKGSHQNLPAPETEKAVTADGFFSLWRRERDYSAAVRGLTRWVSVAALRCSLRLTPHRRTCFLIPSRVRIHHCSAEKQKAPWSGAFAFQVAEREGFEPSMGFNTHTPLAGERLQPLGHLS